jgi:hypothetical protein
MTTSDSAGPEHASTETAESEDTPEIASGLSTEDVYEVLSNRRRRYAIHYLKQADDPVDVSTLAEQVAAWENQKSSEDLDSQERKRVYISLYQSHLPTLEKRGLVDYDDDRGIVELTDSIASADVYLEVVAGQNVPWSYFYIGLSLVSGLLVALTYYEIGILETVAPIAIGGVITALFAISAVFQTLQTGRMQLGDEGPPPEIRTAESQE